jgi:membrane protein YdbS with pleckstrin-like domain
MQRYWNRTTWFIGSVIFMAAVYTAAFRRTVIPDWMLLVDFSVSLPLLHYLLFRPALKQWLVRWAQLTGLGILLGRFIIPESSRVIWPWLELARNALLGLMIPIELGIMGLVAYGVWKLMKLDGDVDHALQVEIERRLGKSPSAQLALWEARIWLYAFFNPHNRNYAGDQHFSYARQNGNASNQLGFIIAILFEMPLAHLLLHFMWSPTAAWIASALSAWGLIYLVSEYRATLARPVSIGREQLYIRCGVLSVDAEIPWHQIQSIETCAQPLRRAPGVRRYKQMGEFNITIHLHPGATLPDIFGRAQAVTKICLGLDDAAGFIDAAKKSLHPL